MKLWLTGCWIAKSNLKSFGRPSEYKNTRRKVTIGQRDKFVRSEYFVGGLLEIIVFDRKLNDSEVKQVEEYLRCEYKISPSICTALSEDTCKQKITKEDCGEKIQYTPNPVENILKIQGLDKNSNENMNVVIVDAIGRIIYRDRVLNSSIDVSWLPSGIFFIKVEGGCTDTFQKIIKVGQ